MGFSAVDYAVLVLYLVGITVFGMMFRRTQRTVKDYYEIEEFAQIVGKAPFTVREWCRLGRIHAEKKNSGRGPYARWVVSHQELLRYQREGLLPARTRP